MPTFELNGKNYQICDNGKFRIQLGKRDKRGKIRYWTVHTFKATELWRACAYFRGYNMGDGYVKRLSYATSENANFYELARGCG
jgi:hypothetical protein